MEFDVWTLLSVVVVLILTLCYVLSKMENRCQEIETPQTEIPGPGPSDPVTGNYSDIVQAGSLHQYLQNCHAQYGDVVQIWFGQCPVVSTASPKVFRDQIRLFDKPEMAFLAPVFGNKSIQFVNGEEAKLRRLNYDSYLNKDSVQRYFPIFKQVTNEMIKELGTGSSTNPINIYNIMFHVTCKAVGVALFGQYFQDDGNIRKFKTLYDQFWPVLEKNFTNGLPEDGTGERKHFDRIVTEVHGTIKDIIAEHKLNANVRKFIDVVMETGLDETTIYGDILVYLVGGFHSVSTTLTWCMYHAAVYPEMQTTIYQEVARVSGNEELSQECIHELRYLRGFIDETLRLRFVAPVATRFSGENTSIGGYNVKPGTHIIHALSVVLTSDRLWKDPDKFDPRRFYHSKAESTSDILSGKRSPLAFCPFGFAGKRMCPGKKFFYSEALLILATLFKHFKFQLSKNTPKDIPIIYGLLTRPAVDVFLGFVKRV